MSKTNSPGIGKILVGLLAIAAISGCGSVATEDATPTATPTIEAITAATDTSAPEATPNTWVQPMHSIGVRSVDGAGEFYDRQSGETFIVRGANYVFVPEDSDRYRTELFKVGVYDPTLTRSDLAHLASYGYNTVRVFLDHCNSGPGCITMAGKAGLNPAYLDNLADFLAAAKAAGIFVLFTSNDLPDEGGYAEEANVGSGGLFAGYRNSYYLTPSAVNATKRYWHDLLAGLIERQADLEVVLGWELLNEQWMFINRSPLSLSAGAVTTTTGSYDMGDPAEKERMVYEGLRYYIAEVKAEILSLDPTALVTMGFFVPELVAPDWYVETAPLLEKSELDFFDFHAYPGPISLRDQAEHFGMLGYDEKPIVMGEYGGFRNLFSEITAAARATGAWVAESCEYGFDGWLYWSYYPNNLGVGDTTWGLVNETDYLLDLFAPINQPDPCIAPEVPSSNLAFGKSVRVSRALPEEAGAFAVDEIENTQWGAGADAPQWIIIDLQGSFRVMEIRLLVAQYPEGNTVHRILVKGVSGDYVTVHEFSGPTRDGDWLVFTPEEPLEGVEFIQIYTVLSPSWVAWREIQVFGEAE